MDSDGPGGEYNVVVIQDVWHARQRVSKHLAKDHPLYKRALAAWNTIFSKLVSTVSQDHWFLTNLRRRLWPFRQLCRVTQNQMAFVPCCCVYRYIVILL
jgi:hypothetical protein